MNDTPTVKTRRNKKDIKFLELKCSENEIIFSAEH